MKLIFIGACHEVTGSCTYIECAGKKFLVDFGMEQGETVFEKEKIPCKPNKIDFVLLTHAHIDHSGLLPLLYAGGFHGKIHSTFATASLCNIMLQDSAHIQEFEADWRSRKARRRGEDGYEPLYTMKEALGAISLFCPHKYNEIVEICDGIKCRFIDAGHLLGSSSIELWLTEGDVTKKIVFSGDIGNKNQPLIRDPQYIKEADYVVMESTYGNRLHGDNIDYVSSLTQILQRTFDRGGSVIIPSFAVGRTQEILYFIRQIKQDNLIKGHKDFPVYVDSPLANEATEIYMDNKDSCYDEEALSYIEKGVNPISFPGLIRTVSVDDSREINNDTQPKVIISASGMCEAGRIKHHLKHNLWKKRNTILFVGYQASNTLGRSLLEGAKQVKLFGEQIAVEAEIARLPGMSGHADYKGLMEWIGNFEHPSMVFVNHGEAIAAEALAKEIRDNLGLKVYAPYSGAEFDIATGVVTNDAKPVYIIPDPKKVRTGSAYENLLDASTRLHNLIKDNSGRANADMRKLTNAINDLIEKWQ